MAYHCYLGVNQEGDTLHRFVKKEEEREQGKGGRDSDTGVWNKSCIQIAACGTPACGDQSYLEGCEIMYHVCIRELGRVAYSNH